MLLKRGKIWYIHFRDVDGKTNFRSLKVTDKQVAEKLHTDFMNNIRYLRGNLALTRLHPEMYPSKPAPAVVTEEPVHQRGGIALDQMLETAQKYRKLSPFHIRAFDRFCRAVGVKYADQVTPKLAQNYLRQAYGSGNGKSYNNNKTYLNTIFKLCLVDAGLQTSPFDALQNMRLSAVQSHRPLTVEEFRRLFETAAEPLKTALLLSWHTGLRFGDCFSLRWSEIRDGAIIKTPAKTSRFARAVYIPVHPELQSHLDTLPRPSGDEPILSVFHFCDSVRIRGGKSRALRLLFDKCKVLDNEQGKASFHSLRSSFVTRCEEAGIPREAIRSMVGHTSDQVTDMYSQDRETPKLLLSLAPALQARVSKSVSARKNEGN